MAERRIDRDAWAGLVRAFIESFGRGNKSAFARRVGVTTRTLDRWLTSQVDVSEQSVRAVAESLGRNPLDLLVALGYYRPTEVSPAAPIDPREDPVIQAILRNRRLSEKEKTTLVKHELERIEQDQARRLADYQWYLQQRRATEGTA